jgi:hypothetical protein
MCQLYVPHCKFTLNYKSTIKKKESNNNIKNKKKKKRDGGYKAPLTVATPLRGSLPSQRDGHPFVREGFPLEGWPHHCEGTLPLHRFVKDGRITG